MVDKYNNTSKDESWERFTMLKMQVSDTPKSMAILIASLESKFGLFEEWANSNVDFSSHEKHEEKENKRQQDKDMPSFNNTSS